MKIHAENLIFILEYGIDAREKDERERLQYTADSACLKGVRDFVAALKKGERVEITPSAG